MRDKSVDDRFYILTLFEIAFEIQDTRRYEEDVMPVHLLMGLPPAHFGSQYERFEKYFERGDVEEFEFHGKQFEIYIAAAMPVYSQISYFSKVMVIDIGGFTADYLLIKSGQADLSVCDTLENGAIVLYN